MWHCKYFLKSFDDLKLRSLYARPQSTLLARKLHMHPGFFVHSHAAPFSCVLFTEKHVAVTVTGCSPSRGLRLANAALLHEWSTPADATLHHVQLDVCQGLWYTEAPSTEEELLESCAEVDADTLILRIWLREL